jgi:hypothetical protein
MSKPDKIYYEKQSTGELSQLKERIPQQTKSSLHPLGFSFSQCLILLKGNDFDLEMI